MDGSEVQENLITRKAVERFLIWFNCAGSVFMPGCELSRIGSDLVSKVATVFGVGAGRRGVLCGAVSVAVMAIGLKFGRFEATGKESKERVYSKAWNVAEGLRIN